MKLSIIGAGSFGTSLAVHLSKNFDKIQLHTISEEVKKEINEKKTNIRYLKDISIPDNVSCSLNIKEVVDGATFVVLAVPSTAVRSVSRMIAPHLTNNQIVVNLAKGIEQDTYKRLSSVIEEEIKNNPIVVLSGPSHAEEIAKGLFTTLIASSGNEEASIKVQDAFITSNLRIYTNSDIVGVEIGAACKNIIALASGLVHGLGHGDNTKAALMVRGVKEITDISIALGANPKTLNGLSGMGDLIVTCTSPHSRNRQAGILLSKGYSLDEALDEVGMVVEGVTACKCFKELSERVNVELPITSALYSVLFEGKNAEQCLYELSRRDAKSEF